jgi:hypothetical protein
MAFGFLAPLVLLCFARQRHVTSSVLLLVIAAGSPVIFIGFRSWRRWFYPNRLPIRWAGDSVVYKRVRAAEWVAAGVNLFAWMAVCLVAFGQETSHQRARFVWLVVALSASVRVVLAQYREDRKPLEPPVPLPSVSPYDPSLRLTNAIHPVYSKDWDAPAEH